jgi:hypothetical protein
MLMILLPLSCSLVVVGMLCWWQSKKNYTKVVVETDCEGVGWQSYGRTKVTVVCLVCI